MAFRRDRCSPVSALLVVSVSLCAFFTAGWSQEKTRIAPSSPGLSAWPIHLAAKEGFFAREGLEVEVIVMRTNVGIAALATGSVDYTTAGGSALRAAALTPPYSIMAKRLGFIDVARTGNILSAWPTTGLVAAREKLEKNPDNVRRVVRAVLRAVHFA